MLKTNKEKEAILLKAMNKGSKTHAQIAKENNIGYSTLKKWLQEEARKKGATLTNSKRFTNKQKLEHVIATGGLTDEPLSAYCRSHGLYRTQITSWKQAFEEESVGLASFKKKQETFRAYQKKCQELEKELRKKDKALAEASALLILKKKAHFIWGEEEEV